MLNRTWTSRSWSSYIALALTSREAGHQPARPRLRELRAQGEAHSPEALVVATTFAQISNTLATLMTKMRVTPNARIRGRQLDNERMPLAGPRPWEVGA